MNIRAALIAAVLAAGPAGSQETAPQEVLLKARYVKDDKITTDSDITFTMDLYLSLDMGDGAQTIKVGMESGSQVGYVTAVLEVDEARQVRKELREYTKASTTVKGSQSFGDNETEMPERKETLSLEGKSLELTREEEGTKVSAKGEAKDIPRDLLHSLQIHEGIETLFPEKAVKKGDRWTLDGKKLKGWAERQNQGLKFKSLSGEIECTLKEITSAGDKILARVEFVVNLEGTADPASLSGMGGGGEEGEDESPKPKMEMTVKIKKGKGEFVFDVGEGASVSSEMESQMEIEMTQDLGGQEMGGKGTGSVKSKTAWKLERAR